MSTAVYRDIEPARSAAPAAQATKWRGGKWSNDQRQTRNAYPVGSSAPLSHEQKAKLCIRAREAFLHLHGHAPESEKALKAWRNAEQQKAVGKDSLTVCTQSDYLPLLAHFAELAGESGEAVDAHIRDATSDVRVALHKLKTECARRGLTLAYVAPICRSKFKCALSEATAAQVWKLVFDVRNSKHKPSEPSAPARPSMHKPTEPSAPARPGPLGPLPAKLVFTKKTTPPVSQIDQPF